VIVTVAVFGFGADEDGTGRGIDDGSGSDTDFRDEVAGFAGVGIRYGGFAGLQHSGFPKLLAGVGIGVEGIDEIAFRGDVDDVVLIAVGHGDVGDVERLGIGVAGDGAAFIDGTGEEQTEGRGAESGGRESVFL